ncbi:hypothetical protein RND81_11G057200 [Saponaria officinalis]|uniref:Uncharacterized protein n=1 Tax=Saponaria officinalis TaxID=3572 RepID=A0AAW1HI62_SAPOF
MRVKTNMETTTIYNSINLKERVEFDMEDDEELFEIDLEVVDNIPPPCYYWDGYFTTTTDALLANCLLPVTDLSNAVPIVANSKALDEHRVVSISFTGSHIGSILLSKMQIPWDDDVELGLV